MNSTLAPRLSVPALFEFHLDVRRDRGKLRRLGKFAAHKGLSWFGIRSDPHGAVIEDSSAALFKIKLFLFLSARFIFVNEGGNYVILRRQKFVVDRAESTLAFA